MSEGQACVDAKGKECQTQDACLGCGEHSECSLSAINGSCEPLCPGHPPGPIWCLSWKAVGGLTAKCDRTGSGSGS